MKKKNNQIHLAFLKFITVIIILTVTFLIVKDVLAQTPEEDKRDEGIVKRMLELLFQNAGSAPVEQDYQGNRDCIDTSNGGGNGGADQNYTGTVDTSFDYQSYGLEPATQDQISEWYAKLTGNNAYWATRLLKSEKLLISKGVNVKPYLTTAWMWFEYNNALTPYLINCNDNRAGFKSEVSFFCSVPNFQVAGYQAATRSSSKTSINYVSMFDKCYGPGASVPSVLQDVVNNSDKAGVGKWSYLDADQKTKDGLVKQFLGGINSADIGKIAPNSSFGNPDTQFFSLMLGKDPCMAIALNSAAVSDSDLIRALRTQASAYGYIDRTQKQKMAAMVGALRKFDVEKNGASADSYFTPGPSPTPRPTCAPASNNPDPNVTSGPLGSANVENYTHYCQCNPDWDYKPADNNICQAGCGITTISSAMTTLGQTTTPNQLRAMWEGRHWFTYGMDTTRDALKELNSGPNFSWDGTDVVENGRVNLQRAKFYFTEGNKNKCILIGSNKDINHIFAISGVNDDGTITVHDSWLGCNPGSRSEKVSYRRQNPSYANYYAFPLCRK